MKKIRAAAIMAIVLMLALGACTKKSRIIPTSPAGAPDAYEQDDEVSAAKEILPDSGPQAHNFSDVCDADYVKISMAAGGLYTVTTDPGSSPLCDTEMTLYSTDGATLLAYDDDSGPGTGSSITYTAATGGFYFVKLTQKNCTTVFGDGTDYTLSVTLAAGTPTITRTPSKTATASRTMTCTFVVTPTGTGTVTLTSTPLPTFTDTPQITFSNTPVITFSDTPTVTGTSTPSPTITYTPSATGTITQTRTASSTFTVTGTRTPLYSATNTPVCSPTVTPTVTQSNTPDATPDIYEDDDTAALARPVIPGGSAEAHNSHDACDNDWYSFTASQYMQYTVQTSIMGSRSALEIRIYDAGGTSQLAYAYSTTRGTGTTLVWTAPADGVYTVKINQYNCSSYYGANTEYTFSFAVSSYPMTPTRTPTLLCVTTAPDAYEDDDTAALARLITAGSAAEPHTSHDWQDNDWYRFDAVQGTLYTVKTSIMGAKSAVAIRLYDTNGVTELAYNYSGTYGNGTTLVWTAPAGGQYYVKISQYYYMYSCGADTEYSVELTGTNYTATQTRTKTVTMTMTLFISPTVTPTPHNYTPDAFEDDDSAAAASSITAGGPAQQHNSHDACDSDWYSFSAAKNTFYTMKTTIMGSNSAVYIYIYGTDGATQLAYAYNTVRGNGTTLNWMAPEDGIYYAKISQYNCETYYGENTEYTVALTGAGPAMTETVTKTITLTPTNTVTPDIYEDDDSAANARLVTPGGAAEQHNSHDYCDYDWYKFSAAQGREYTIEASAMGINSDVYIAIFGTDGYTYIKGLSSVTRGTGVILSWTAPADGVYFVRISQDACWSYYGHGTEYTVSFTESAAVMTATSTYTETLTATETPTPADTSTPYPPDAYEDDDSAAKARLISAGAAEQHNSHDYCDEDWFKFSAVRNTEYTLKTVIVGSETDTDIYIYNTDGYSYMASASSSSIGTGATLSWVAPADGVYYVQITQDYCYTHYGPNTEYTLLFTGGGSTVTPVITNTPTETYTYDPTNTYTPTITRTPYPPDAYEDDDSAAKARLFIANGASEAHNSHDACDADWYKFDALENVEYEISTAVMGSKSATYIYLCDTDGYTVIDYEYGYSSGMGASLTWVAPANGRYYIKIVQYNCSSNFGADTEYTLSLAASAVTMTPTVTRTFTLTRTYTGTPTGTVTPDIYEDDDTAAAARAVVPGGTPEAHNSHDSCDFDWYKFIAAQNVEYTVRTFVMGSNSAAEIRIYDATGMTLLASKTNYIHGTGTTLSWIAPSDAEYLVRISQYACGSYYGANTEYTVSFTGAQYTVTPSNTFTETATVPLPTNTATPDAFEDDDSAVKAGLIAVGGAAQQHNSHDSGDPDWYKFNAAQNVKYTVSTGAMGSNSSVRITLYGPDGYTQLASEYNYTLGLGTTLVWVAPADGMYYVKIAQTYSYHYGHDTEYTVSFTGTSVTMTPTFTFSQTFTRTYTYTKTNTPVPTITNTPYPPDAYEDDDSAVTARLIAVGGPAEQHTSHDACDYDWFKFAAIKNMQYTVKTSIMGSNSTSQIYIMGTNGYTVLASQYSYSDGVGTALTWTAPEDGIYYARISQYDCNYSNNYGANTEYTVSFTGTSVTMTPTDTRTFTRTPTETYSPTPVVSPDPYEDDDTAVKARLVAVGGPPETHNSHDYCDYDWYKFSAVKNIEYTVSTEMMGEDSAVYIYVYDTDAYTQLVSAYSQVRGVGTALSWVAPADGVYFVRVAQYNCWSYSGLNTEYTVSFTGRVNTVTPSNTLTATNTYTDTPAPTMTYTPCPPDTYEDDDTYGNARPAVMGGPAETHNSHDYCDYDWYVLSGIKNRQYTIKTSIMGSNSAVVITMFNIDGYTQLGSASNGTRGYGTTLVWTAPADGTYYVRVEQYSCYSYYGANTEYNITFEVSGYTVTPTFTGTSTYTPSFTMTPTLAFAPDAYEDDDSAVKARLVAAGGAVEQHNSHDNCDADWYKFSAEQNIQYTVQTLAMGSRSSVYIYLYDTDGYTALASNYSYTDGQGTKVVWTAPAAGIYYVKIIQYSCSYNIGPDTEYSVSFTGTSVTMTPTLTQTFTNTRTFTYTPTNTLTPYPPDVYEDDDVIARARPVTAGGPAETHNSHDSCDYDWYSFSAVKNTQYTVAASAMGARSAVYIYLYNTDGSTQLTYAYSSTRGTGTTLSWVAPADGTYYVRINQYSCSSYFGPDTEYTVSFTGSADTVTPTNTFTYTLTPTATFTPTDTVTPDPYEDDDSAPKARLMAVGGAAETHNSHDSCDYDWYKFDAQARIQYTVSASAMGSNSAVYIYIYGIDGYTQLAYAYSYTRGTGTTLSWVAPADGTYYVKINQYSCSSYYGANTEYTVSFAGSAETMTPTLTPTLTNTRTSTYTPTMTFTPYPPDAYEEDDSAAKANTVVVNGASQTHNSHDACDYDWYKFAATGGVQHTITASGMGSNSAVYIYIYGTDGYTQINYAYSYTRGTGTTISWTPAASGVYYAKIYQYSCGYYFGLNTQYTVSFTSP